MSQTYPEFIKADENMCEQRKTHLLLENYTLSAIREGLLKSHKTDISMSGIYNRLFPSSHNKSSHVAAHRLRLFLQDGCEREAIEQIEKIASFADPYVRSIANHSFLLALTGKMPGVVSTFFSRGFPKSVNSRIFGSKDSYMFPTYFHLALAAQNLSTILLFFKRTIEYQETWHGLGPVHLSAINPDIRVLDMVLTRGGNPMEFTTTVQYSFIQGLSAKRDALRNAESEGPGIKGSIESGRPIYPIDLAAVSGNWGALLFLMNKCPKSAIHSQHILHILNSLEMVVKAINIGARVQTSLFNGATLLHTKSLQNRPEMVAFYLALGVSPETRNKDGKTPLQVSAEKQHRECLWVLMKGGADVPEELLLDERVREIAEGRWRPAEKALEKIERYRESASLAVVVRPKAKSRFSIMRLLHLEQKTGDGTVQKTNEKIEKVGKAAQAAAGKLEEHSMYERYMETLF